MSRQRGSDHTKGELQGIFLARGLDPGTGVPLAIKDLFDTKGQTTTYGSAVFRDHIPSRTAVAVQQLERAGYVNIGKTNLDEFAYGTTSENPHFGSVPNPRASGRIAGGSSGGSAAALAAGIADAALGTDSGGSIRIPAACCGVVGFKPSHGLISLDGCFPLAPSFDHAGPMARDVDGCIHLMQALVPGFQPLAPEVATEVRVGVAWTDHASPAIAARVGEAAARLPSTHPVAELPLPRGFYAAFMQEVADVHRRLFAEHKSLYGSAIATKIGRCLRVSANEVESARRARERYSERILRVFDDVDLLLTPTLDRVAPPLGVGDLRLRKHLTRFTFGFNSTGMPSLAMPCGAAEHGLPASLQVVGPVGHDALVLAVGQFLARK